MRCNLSSLFYLFFGVGIVLLPFSTSPDDGGVVSFGLPFLVIAAIPAALVFIYSLKHVDPVLVLLSTAYILLIVVMTFFSPSFLQASARTIVHVIGYLIFLGLLRFLVVDRNSQDIIARMCIVSCCILAAYFLVNFGLSALAIGVESVVMERYVGGAMSLPWGASNTIAQVLLLAFVFFALLEKRKAIDSILLLIISIGILFTFSRSVIFLMLLMYFVNFSARWMGKFAIYGVLLVFLIGFTVSFDFSSFDGFIADRINPESIYTGNSRLDLMAEKIDHFLLNPLTPIGYYGSLSYFEYSAHNYWLTTLVEQSFIGIIVSFGFFVYVAYEAFSISAKVGMAFVVIMLALMVEDPHFTQPYIILFWTLLAILGSIKGVRCSLPRSTACEA
jgi:hypothetical protein